MTNGRMDVSRDRRLGTLPCGLFCLGQGLGVGGRRGLSGKLKVTFEKSVYNRADVFTLGADIIEPFYQ